MATEKLDKNLIIEEISNLFLKYGLRSTSMDDISRSLKISKKTLYQLFTNKNDVVEQVVLKRMHDCRNPDALEKFLQGDAISILFDMRNHIDDEIMVQLPANLYDCKKYHPMVYQMLIKDKNKFVASLLDTILTKGMKEGTVRSDLNKEMQIEYFIQTTFDISNPDRECPLKISTLAMYQTIMENYIRIVASPKGMIIFEKLNTKTNNK